jgi:hypothetical protein
MLALLPSDDPASLTLPGEHDIARALELRFLGRARANGESSGTEEQMAVARELHALSVVNAACFTLLWGSCTMPGGLRAGGGHGGSPATAHLPFHAYLAGRLLGLICLLCGRS